MAVGKSSHSASASGIKPNLAPLSLKVMGVDGVGGLLVSPREPGVMGWIPAGRSTTWWRQSENCFCPTQHNVTHHPSIHSLPE